MPRRKANKRGPSFGIYANEYVPIEYGIEDLGITFADPADALPKSSKVKSKARAARAARNKPPPAPEPPQPPPAKVQFTASVIGDEGEPSERAIVEEVNANANDSDHLNDLASSRVTSQSKTPATLRFNRVPTATLNTTQDRSIYQKHRPLQGREARHADHVFSKWKVEGKCADRDILCIDADALFHNRPPAKGKTRPKSAGPRRVPPPPDAASSPTKTRRPLSAHVNYRRSNAPPQINYDKPRWNVEATLDDSRQSSAKLTSHPGIDYERAQQCANERQFKPVNMRFFNTTTSNAYGKGC